VRLVSIEQLRSDPKLRTARNRRNDRLDDFLLIYDELNDNIDTYVDRQERHSQTIEDHY